MTIEFWSIVGVGVAVLSAMGGLSAVLLASINGRFSEIDHRFDDMRSETGLRFDETGRRFDEMRDDIRALREQQERLGTTVADLAGTVNGLKPHIEHLDRLTEQLVGR